MPRLPANLSYLFTERPFVDRFEAATRCGFRAIEHQFPYSEASESATRNRLTDSTSDFRIPLIRTACRQRLTIARSDISESTFQK